MLGRLLLSIDSIMLLSGGFLADWNETHVFNPRWPPYAKYFSASLSLPLLLLHPFALQRAWRYLGTNTHHFNRFHNAQTIALASILGGVTLYFTWRPASSQLIRNAYLAMATITGSVYWISGFMAYRFPNTDGLDPEFGGPGFPQAVPFTVGLSLAIAGFFLEW